MQKEKIKNLIDASLKAHPDLFLIDFKINQGNQLRVVIDGDQAVSVDDCMSINRSLEERLNQEEEDFSIEVTSAGITTPLQFVRQYKKNIGRKLKVSTKDKQYKARLVEADDKGIILSWKQREPKPVGKGKHTVEKTITLAYTTITEAKVIITFN